MRAWQKWSPVRCRLRSKLPAASGFPNPSCNSTAPEYGRTGFQGGLQWYRCGTSDAFVAEHQLFSGRTIDVPSCFISGASDWGTYQKPGAFEAMQERACTQMIGCHLVNGAGHWVQQEQPEQVVDLLLAFFRNAEKGNQRARCASWQVRLITRNKG